MSRLWPQFQVSTRSWSSSTTMSGLIITPLSLATTYIHLRQSSDPTKLLWHNYQASQRSQLLLNTQYGWQFPFDWWNLCNSKPAWHPQTTRLTQFEPIFLLIDGACVAQPSSRTPKRQLLLDSDRICLSIDESCVCDWGRSILEEGLTVTNLS